MAGKAIMAIIFGAIGASIVFGIYMYSEYQPNYFFVNSGEPVKVGPVLYQVQHIGEHDGDEETSPQGTFLQIQIIAENLGNEETRITGGQFYLIDESERRFQPIFGNFSDIDLLTEILPPNSPITRMTQFDIEYDSQSEYRVGILPTKTQSSRDIGIVCIKNC